MSWVRKNEARRAASLAPRATRQTEDDPMTTNSWNIDAAHSGINFSIRHMVVSKVRGRFAKYTGTITIDDGDLTRSSVEVSIDGEHPRLSLLRGPGRIRAAARRPHCRGLPRMGVPRCV